MRNVPGTISDIQSPVCPTEHRVSLNPCIPLYPRPTTHHHHTHKPVPRYTFTSIPPPHHTSPPHTQACVPRHTLADGVGQGHGWEGVPRSRGVACRRPPQRRVRAWWINGGLYPFPRHIGYTVEPSFLEFKFHLMDSTPFHVIRYTLEPSFLEF